MSYLNTGHADLRQDPYWQKYVPPLTSPRFLVRFETFIDLRLHSHHAGGRVVRHDRQRPVEDPEQGGPQPPRTNNVSSLPESNSKTAAASRITTSKRRVLCISFSDCVVVY
jgi:hypothetical protein